MKKAERLSVAAAVAPVLRRQTEAVKKRRVKVYVQETGEVVGEITLAEAQAGILATARIEFDTAEGVKETHRECALCGKPFAIDGHGHQIKTCDGCRMRQTKCAGEGCDAVPVSKAFCASSVARRKGAPWMCVTCKLKSPEFRARHADAMRRRGKDPEYRAKHAERLRRAREAKRAKNEQRPGAASAEGERE